LLVKRQKKKWWRWGSAASAALNKKYGTMMFVVPLSFILRPVWWPECFAELLDIPHTGRGLGWGVAERGSHLRGKNGPVMLLDGL
jgi:hypothetical protein